MKKTYLILVIITLLFSCFIFFACNNTNVSTDDQVKIIEQNEIKPDTTKEIEKFDKKDTISNYKFSIRPLDSLFCELEEKQINKMDSIKKDTILLGMFRVTEGLESIYIKYNKSFDCYKNKNFIMKPITQLIFNNVNNAQNSFSIFVEDLFDYSNFYIWYLKAGAICFIEENSIYLIKVHTCGSNKEIDLIEKVIREQVFNNKEFNGIKVYCGLKNPQKLKF